MIQKLFPFYIFKCSKPGGDFTGVVRVLSQR
jgi:hypothetical protein